MLEWWTGGLSHHTLHEDLKVGRNTAWQQGILACPPTWASDNGLYNINDPFGDLTIEYGAKMRYFSQYYRYIRPGAVRIDAATNDNGFDPLAFVDTNGMYMVLVKGDGTDSIFIDGLAGGTYGISYTTGGELVTDGHELSINGGGTLRTRLPAAGVLVAFQKSGIVGRGRSRSTQTRDKTMHLALHGRQLHVEAGRDDHVVTIVIHELNGSLAGLWETAGPLSAIHLGSLAPGTYHVSVAAEGKHFGQEITLP